MLSKVVLQILPRNVMWRERSISKALVREAHGNIGNICSSGYQLRHIHIKTRVSTLTSKSYTLVFVNSALAQQEQ